MNMYNEQFNFSNNVSYKKSSDPTDDFDCKGIMLEPRLQEYIKKVKIYKQNNIDPGVSLKTQYLITKDDMMKISSFMKGNKHIYPKTKLPKSSKHLSSQNSLKFPSSSWKSDSRVPKNLKNDYINPNDTLMFSSMQPNIDNSNIIDHRDFSSPISTRADPYYSFQSFENIYNGKIYQPKSNGKKPYFDALENQAKSYSDLSRIGDRHSYHWENSNNIGSDRYGSLPIDDFHSSSFMDEEHKLVIPNVNFKNGKQLDTSGYTPIPFMGHGTGPRDVEMELEIQQGMPLHPRNKSYGYPPTEEFNFDYAPIEYQDPDHVVFPTPRGGISTRVFNKSIKHKQKKRQIM